MILDIREQIPELGVYYMDFHGISGSGNADERRVECLDWSSIVTAYNMSIFAFCANGNGGHFWWR